MRQRLADIIYDLPLGFMTWCLGVLAFVLLIVVIATSSGSNNCKQGKLLYFQPQTYCFPQGKTGVDCYVVEQPVYEWDCNGKPSGTTR